MTGRMFLWFAAVAIAVTAGLCVLTAVVIWPHMGFLAAEADGGVCGLLGLAAGFAAATAVER